MKIYSSATALLPFVGLTGSNCSWLHFGQNPLNLVKVNSTQSFAKTSFRK
jgi:hypothetical protein